MENKRLKLPIGIQTFEKLRGKNCVYVDKTGYLVRLIDDYDICFLARPRRFGKSLTVSTFDALFSGKKELFKGLYAEEYLNRPDFVPSPVIRLDMGNVTTHLGMEVMENSIKEKILQTAKELGVDIKTGNSAGDSLNELIINTRAKYDREVVILLDEYDKPYTDFVNDPVMAENVRNSLRSFYVQIKSNDKHIRFTFITGISKFARMGVFSVFNTPHDISLSPEYAAMCGYTEDEIKQYFPDYLEDTANYMKMTTEELIEKMRNYYNGFSFDRNAEVRLYNPFSTLLFFAEKDFANYWIESGKSKVIADYMKNRHLTVEQFRNLPISNDFARSPGDMDTTPPEGFLYQGGYLTLRRGTSGELVLDYPNTEVLNSMSQLLTQNIFADKTNFARNSLLIALRNSDADKLVEVLNRLLAGIPYDDFTYAATESISLSGSKMTAREWLYRSTILAFVRGCGVKVAAEVHSNLGQADLVIAHGDVTWVIEIKVAYEGQNPETKEKQALRQIETKNYAKQYDHAISVVLVIDDETRQITKKTVK
jgi:hypothetical protein